MRSYLVEANSNIVDENRVIFWVLEARTESSAINKARKTLDKPYEFKSSPFYLFSARETELS